MTREITAGDIFLINGMEYKVITNLCNTGLVLSPNNDCFCTICTECNYYPDKCVRKIFKSSDEMLTYLKEVKENEI